ncbi:MAG: hypothetical protein K0R18_215 [Bacillales bacterium]|jgi:hypothetical protein|nr:hypothetical protein [Bacillales bacterium]
MTKPVEVTIHKVEDDSYWISGTATCNNHLYEWYGKVDDEKSKNGLDKGRITKLVVRNGEVEDSTTEDVFWLSVIANFDRDWVTKPNGPEATEVFYSIVDEVERIETYDERIYCGSKIKKAIGKTKKALSLN